jgi:hypothetical protein
MKRINVFGMQTVLVNNTPVNTFRVRVTNNDYNESVLAPLSIISKDLRVTPVTTFRNNKYQSLIEVSYTGMNWEIDMVVFKTVGKSLKDIQVNKLNERYSWTNDPEEVLGC